MIFGTRYLVLNSAHTSAEVLAVVHGGDEDKGKRRNVVAWMGKSSRGLLTCHVLKIRPPTTPALPLYFILRRYSGVTTQPRAWSKNYSLKFIPSQGPMHLEKCINTMYSSKNC